jgi:glycerophosphoryl diester phosphodiesterase
MEVIGHRGVTGSSVPENTLAAVEAALAAGAHGVEVDVRLTADRVAVCVHDPDLRRVAGLAVLVERTCFTPLRRMALPGGHVVPTLREVAVAVAGHGRLVVDVKPDRRVRTLARKVLEAVDGVPRQDLTLSSTDPQLLLELGSRDPEQRLALIASSELDRSVAWAVGLGCDALHPELRSLLTAPEVVTQAREAHLRLRAWTVNRAVDGELLERIGCDAVITDDPTVLLARTPLSVH